MIGVPILEYYTAYDVYFSPSKRYTNRLFDYKRWSPQNCGSQYCYDSVLYVRTWNSIHRQHGLIVDFSLGVLANTAAGFDLILKAYSDCRQLLYNFRSSDIPRGGLINNYFCAQQKTPNSLYGLHLLAAGNSKSGPEKCFGDNNIMWILDDTVFYWTRYSTTGPGCPKGNINAMTTKEMIIW